MAKIPVFKSEKEEREFWDTHSSADYWEDMEECSDAFKKPKLKSVSLKLDPNILEKIKVVAHKRGLSYNALIRYLLSKGLEREMRKVS
jgi:predicted DNA binding CopG/RHH family protein